MSQLQEEIKQVELSIEEAKKAVNEAELAYKLSTNAAFKKLVLEGYFVEEAARLAHLLTDPEMVNQGAVPQIENAIKGIGGFKRYLSTKMQLGAIAENAIRDNQETLEELREEELSEGQE